MRATELVIIAGGKGMRLAAIAGPVPKSLVPVCGKPVLELQLASAARAGVRRATILAGHLAEQIIEFVGDGARFGLEARVFVETLPLGTAGGLIANLDEFDEHFIVVYGDILFDIDWSEMISFHVDRCADMTLLVHPNDHPYDSDLVDVDRDGRVRAIHACPHPPGASFANLVNAACYVLRRDALTPWTGAGGPIDFTKDVMIGLINRGAHVAAFRSLDYAKDMGTPERLARAEADWRAGHVRQARAARAPAIFLDRDGTLIEERGHLRSAEEVVLLEGAAASLRRLRNAGFRLVVVTNQPVVARGEASIEDVERANQRLEWLLGLGGAYVDGVYYCPHHPDRGFPGERTEFKTICDCRKPATGMIDQAMSELFLRKEGSWVVGDQTRDIELARRAGLNSVLVGTGQAGRDSCFDTPNLAFAPNLASAASLILKDRGQ
jgi:histidinol-phosphate phosphatase family protein